MKNTGLQFLSVLLLAVLLLMTYRESVAQREFRAEMGARVQSVEERFAAVEMQMDAQRSKMQALEDKSVGGLVENTGRALSDGWQAMMNTLEREIEKAEELAKEQKEAWDKSQQERREQREAQDAEKSEERTEPATSGEQF